MRYVREMVRYAANCDLLLVIHLCSLHLFTFNILETVKIYNNLCAQTYTNMLTINSAAYPRAK